MPKGFDPDQVYEEAKEQVKRINPLFLDEIFQFTSFGKTTFYKYFPDNSNGTNELQGIIKQNQIAMKSSIRKRWYESDDFKKHIALYKLIGKDEERQRLQQQYIKQEAEVENTSVTSAPIIDPTNLSTDALKELNKQLKQIEAPNESEDE